jgi:TPP-dependent pyruvate/acetoin dehydrogenase alpha subunit
MRKEDLMTKPTPKLLIGMFRRMLEIRHFEQSVADLATSTAKIPGPVHVSIGQEAVAVGVCSALRLDDTIVGTHRSHGYTLAKGASARSVMAEVMGGQDGCCKGYGGSMHVTDVAHGMLACTAIVGGGFGMAGGAAFSYKLRRIDRVSVCFFGDGALGQGSFYEILNMASKWALPLVLVCDNNLYAMSTSAEKVRAFSSCSDLATPYHISGAKVDGNNILEVYQAACTAVDRARRGDGPSILDCITYRWSGHGVADDGVGVYRTAEEMQSWKKRDPINQLREYLVAKKLLDEAGAARMDEEAKKITADAVSFAESSPRSKPEQAWNNLYSKPILEVYQKCES